MTRVALFLGAGAVALSLVGLSPVASAVPILSSVSHAGNASAGTVSGKYVYGPYGNPRHPGYGWHVVFVQSTSAGAGAPLNGSSGVQTSAGTYYGPAYSATGQSSNTFSDTDTLAVLRVHLKTAVTLTTPKIPHQRASAAAQASDTLSFTLANDSSVSLDVSGGAGNTVQIVDQVTGEVVFTVHGAGSFHDALSAGDYAVVGNAADSASQDTQYNTLTNPGSTTAPLDYAFSVSPAS